MNFCYSQKSAGYSLFRLLNSGKVKKEINQPQVRGIGTIDYKDSTLFGQMLITNADIQLKSENRLFAYSNSDTSINKVIIEDNLQAMELVRLKDFDSKLWRLLKDTLGVRVYDKNISYTKNGSAIDYNSLLFHGNGQYYEAVTFWVTSTKRNIVKILNQLLELNLSPKQFKSKEDVLDRLLSNDKLIYSNG